MAEGPGRGWRRRSRRWFCSHLGGEVAGGMSSAPRETRDPSTPLGSRARVERAGMATAGVTASAPGPQPRGQPGLGAPATPRPPSPAQQVDTAVPRDPTDPAAPTPAPGCPASSQGRPGTHPAPPPHPHAAPPAAPAVQPGGSPKKGVCPSPLSRTPRPGTESDDFDSSSPPERKGQREAAVPTHLSCGPVLGCGSS